MKGAYSLPGSSWFFYLKLRTALRTYGVPWDAALPQHPLVPLVTTKTKPVSSIYDKLISANITPLAVTNSWERTFHLLHFDWNWPDVWNAIFSSSKNAAHQIIHFKFIHKFYFTPERRFKCKLVNSDLCTICTSARGDYLHMFWYCPSIKRLWIWTKDTVANIIGKALPSCPSLFLIGYNPNILLTFQDKRILLAASTAAKKTIIKNWFEPTIDLKINWRNCFLDICLLERSTARMNGARADTVDNWSRALEAAQPQSLIN